MPRTSKPVVMQRRHYVYIADIIREYQPSGDVSEGQGDDSP